MSRAACKSKIAYFSREMAEALALPGTEIYLCSKCSNFHATSKSNGSRKNKERFEKYKRRK